MKKTNDRNIFKIIISFFDKWLITPITKFFIMIIDFFTGNAKTVEKLLNNRQLLVVISLIFALATFFLIDGRSNSLIDNNAEVLYGQPVKATYSSSLYIEIGRAHV